MAKEKDINVDFDKKHVIRVKMFVFCVLFTETEMIGAIQTHPTTERLFREGQV